jgi:hypothetical protein
VSADDPVLEALDAFVAALRANEASAHEATARAELIRAQRAAGRSYREIVAAEDRPLIVEIASRNLERLHEAGSRLRRAEARALHREGMTMDAIAQLFGVTRQRVSALLRGNGAPT